MAALMTSYTIFTTLLGIGHAFDSPSLINNFLVGIPQTFSDTDFTSAGACIPRGNPCDDTAPNQCCPGMQCADVNRRGVICTGLQAAEALPETCIALGNPCDDTAPNQCCPGMQCADVNRRGVICTGLQAAEALPEDATCIALGNPCDDTAPNQCCPGMQCADVNRRGVICTGLQAAEALPETCIALGNPCDDTAPNQCCPGMQCADVNRIGVICTGTQAADVFLQVATGPAVAPQFTATLQFKTSDFGPSGVANGIFVYDAHAQKSLMATMTDVPMFGPGVVMNHTTLALGSGANSTAYTVTNSQCMHLTGVYAQAGFASLFSWFPLAKKAGQDVVKGKTCEKWSLTLPPPKNQSLVACLHEDEPLYISQQAGTITFDNFQRVVDPAKLQIPTACQEEPKPCGSNKIIKQTIYLAHPLDNYNISGQDVADAKGDAVFLCTDKGMWTIGNYKLLSAFELSVVDSFSQYTNFPPPGSKGFGGDGYHIGRSTPMEVGQHGGQCDEDAELWKRLGVWYSLPRGGQCISAKSHQLGVNCTWRIERRLNTIEMDCLLNQRKMVEKCEKAKAPFDDVTELLLKALASQDVAQGGCPSVTSPMCKQHPACAHLSGDCCPHQDGSMFDCCSATDLGRATIVV